MNQDSELAAKLRAMSQSLAETPVYPMRKREFVYIAVFAFLLGWFLLDRNSVNDQLVISEANTKACERHREIAQIHARTIAQLGENGGTISFAGKPAATCKRVKS